MTKTINETEDHIVSNTQRVAQSIFLPDSRWTMGIGKEQNMIEELRKASVLKKKLLDETEFQEGREVSMTIIEQNFTNFNRCLFIIKIENMKSPISNLNSPEQRPKEIQNSERKPTVNEKSLIDRSSISVIGSKTKLKISDTKLKEGLSNFMFDLFPEDQRYQSRHCLTESSTQSRDRSRSS